VRIIIVTTLVMNLLQVLQPVSIYGLNLDKLRCINDFSIV
jgi:hypothetical protein